MAGDDLFSAAARQRLAAHAPLAARLRPRRLDDVVGQAHLVGPGAPLRRLVETDALSSCVLWGPPGTGKTTLAMVIAETTERHFAQLSAVTAGVKDVREVIEQATARLGQFGQRTILFLDEVHRFNKAQQDALLPAVEDGTLTLIGATTENPFFELNPALRSRSTLFRLEPLGSDDVAALVRRGLQAEQTTAAAAAVELLVARAGGDGRAVLSALEVACALAAPGPVELSHVEAALGTSALRYGIDDRYDVVSAFIKSMRGSDPDAAVYWLARMLEAGEDPRFIVRRMIILASEDIGLADSRALLVATAAAQALDYVGLPEAQLAMAQACLYLACAPKSNRAARAIWDARSDVAQGVLGEVPAHLRDAHYRGAASLGHGSDYVYPHDEPACWVPQEYRPAEAADRRYYQPSSHGDEGELSARMADQERGPR